MKSDSLVLPSFKPKLHKNLREVLRIAHYWKDRYEGQVKITRWCHDPSHRSKP